LHSNHGQDNQFRRHIPALDGVRGCAAAAVFAFHYGGGAQSSFLPLRVIGNIHHFGWAGVSLFFVLSGFLISGILWDGYQKPSWWRRFYVRRSLRIFPLYYLAIFLAVAVWLAFHIPLRQLTPLWVYVLYLENFPVLFPLISHLPASVEIGHFWSLAVEEQFYLLWPFVLALFAGNRRGAKHMILTLWVLSLAFRVAVQGMNLPEWGSYFLLSRAGELLAGAYLALVVRGDAKEQQRLFRVLPYVLGISLLLLGIVSFFSPDGDIGTGWWCILGLAFLSIFFASIVGLSLKPGILQSFFQLPLLRWLGKISYGIYIYHLLFRHGFIWLTDRIAPHLGYNAKLVVLFLVALAGTLAIASLSFYTYERAFLRLKERLGH